MIRTPNMEELPGNLYFADYPDPTTSTQPLPGQTIKQNRESAKTPVNSRLILTIRNEPRLPKFLHSIHYRSDGRHSVITFVC